MVLTWHTPSPTLPGPWRIKAGFDPTSPDLHLGHAVVFLALRRLQDEGHEVILLVGDFTATLGDPTGRQKARPALSADEAVANAATYAQQALRFLDPARTTVEHNRDWFGSMSAAELLAVCQEGTVAHLLARQDFKQRLAQGEGLGVHELIYPLLQGYDSVQVRAQVEVGGDDQVLNLLMGRTLQAHRGQTPQAVATVPLLLGLDGERKMSKSLGNHIALNDPPTQVYGKTMRVSDAQVPVWAGLLGLVAVGEPYAAKRELARGVTRLLCGLDAMQAADADWEERFVRREVASQAPEHAVAAPTRLDQLLVAVGFVPSMTQARQKVREGAVRLDGVVCPDAQALVSHGVLQLGRRQVVKLVAGPE